MNLEKLRNIAIIAHVDHGKTTLVDKLLQQSGTLDRKEILAERIMDSNDQERERGITILAKNTAIEWHGYNINIVDTPGHADFGGEVERVLSMVDSVLLIVDAVDGPMPQTRFVTAKAFEQGLNPIVVINKIDRDSARPDWVINQVMDLFMMLDATEEQLYFPICYTSATQGIAGLALDKMAEDMTPLLQLICDQVQPPQVDIKAPLQMQISSLDYNSYVGVIGIARIARGIVKENQPVVIIDKVGKHRRGRVKQVMRHKGLERYTTAEASAGDIVCITGIEKLLISDTICDQDHPEALPVLSVDEPTVSVTFQVNDSPFAAQDGKFVTSRHLKARLDKELIHNVALRVEVIGSNKFKVSGRGELHLSVLIENMRREGYELGVSRPEVILKDIDGVTNEPIEKTVFDIEEGHQGTIIQEISQRQGKLQDMQPDNKGRVKLVFAIPSRGLIGFRGYFLTLTSGTGIMTSGFDRYAPAKTGKIAKRGNGVLISMIKGKTAAYALFNLQNRGKMFLGHGVDIYEGQIIGIHSRENDLPVNPVKGKQLTNVRASGTDEALTLTPPLNFSLEQNMAFIEEDELVEVTPYNIRLRKKHLTENERKRNRS